MANRTAANPSGRVRAMLSPAPKPAGASAPAAASKDSGPAPALKVSPRLDGSGTVMVLPTASSFPSPVSAGAGAPSSPGPMRRRSGFRKPFTSKKSYGSRKVVKDVSLSVAKGEVVGLLGPNGGQNHLFCYDRGPVRADGGQILLDGQSIENQPIHRRARLGLGYLPQEASIFRKLNVEDNIRAVLELQHDDQAVR